MKKVIAFVFTVLFITTVFAQREAYEKKVYVSSNGDSLLNRQLSPEKQLIGEKYPLVIFLHGAGERGNDNEAQLTHGGNMFTNPVNREKYPAYVIFPQCPKEDFWAPRVRPNNFNENPFSVDSEPSQSLLLVKEMLDDVIQKYPIDTRRIYVAGLSMGGMGTFDMLCRYPDLFAAAVPICGGVNTERLSGIKTKTNIRIYHGDADAIVPVTFSREAYKALKNNDAQVEYIEFPGVNHDSWTPAFNQTDFLEWIFSKKK